MLVDQFQFDIKYDTFINKYTLVLYYYHISMMKCILIFGALLACPSGKSYNKYYFLHDFASIKYIEIVIEENSLLKDFVS